MLTGLMLTAFLMGLGGMPHCAVMCGAPCAAAFPRGLPLLALVGRALGYALLGGVAAASAGIVASWGREFAALRPFWLMAQMGAVLFGLWLLWQARVPAWLDTAGVGLYHRLKARFPGGASRSGRAARAGLLLISGMAWALLPCGLLYGALMVAVLAPDALGGGLVMLSFALASSAGVWFAPAVLAWLRKRLGRGRPSAAESVSAPRDANGVVPVLWLKQDEVDGSQPSRPSESSSSAPDAQVVDPRWALRLSGGMLALMAGWGLSHHLVAQWRAWCA